MLHSSSSQYYACYYALLCLLYHQQQALAVTILIDGATTNEWATKDEYRRLAVALSQAAAAAAAAAATTTSPETAAELGAAGDGSGGARSLSELVPATDADFDDDGPVNYGGGANSGGDSGGGGGGGGSGTGVGFGTTRRDTAKKYCGDRLVQALDVVCLGKYFNGDAQPEISEPVVKTKRSVYYIPDSGSDDELSLRPDSEAAAGALGDGDAGSTPVVARRRKLRTIQTTSLFGGGYGDPLQASPLSSLSSSSSSTSSSSSPTSSSSSTSSLSSSTSSLSSSSSSLVHDGNNVENNNHNHNHNHKDKKQNRQQRYLSKSNFDNNNNNNNNNNYYNNLSANRNRQTRRAKLRGIRGVVSECCLRACTFEELRQYCKP
jgi:hypothetical protein